MNIAPKPKVWRLMVFGVSNQHAALMQRLGFRQSKKSLATWWRTFKPKNKGAREAAKETLIRLNQAGLTGRRWDEVEDYTRPASKPKLRAAKTKLNFGYTDFAVHNSTPGTYRLKQRRK